MRGVLSPTGLVNLALASVRDLGFISDESGIPDESPTTSAGNDPEAS